MRNVYLETRVRYTKMIDTTDAAMALDELTKWIGRDPDSRSVCEIRQFGTRWRVSLQVGPDQLTPSDGADLCAAIRHALEIAALAGHL